DDARRAPAPAYSRTGDLVSFADGYPLQLTGEASLAELNRSLESPVPMTRFRPNAVVSTGAAWQEETWRSVTIGRVGLDVAKPCGRCVVTTVPQALDDRPPGEDRTEPLKTLSRMHTVNGKAVFGVNLIPRTDGVLRIGDELRPHTSVMGG
ncbi:MAG: MOSC domain-containing protein, partial [Rhodothermales bacterium]|nr:MOSC domain-containing protein [Rhodothermales bacterium]